MKRRVQVLAALLLASAPLGTTKALAQSDKPLAISKVALRADAPVLFVPRGWKIQHQINGHLDRDNRQDAALVLVESRASAGGGEPPARQRALVVLLREGKGWRRVGFNNTLLLGTRDGGVLYSGVETPVRVTIRKGILIVSQENGSREVLDTTHRFRFDGQSRMMLIGFDSILRDRADGSARIISTNFLRGVRHIDLLAAQSDTRKRKTVRVSRRLRPLEEVKGEERYAE